MASYGGGRCGPSAPHGSPSVCDRAYRPAEGIFLQEFVEIDKLALGPAAIEHTIFERRDACGVITAIFQPLQCIHKQRRDLFTPDNSNDPAHKQLQYPE